MERGTLEQWNRVSGALFFLVKKIKKTAFQQSLICAHKGRG